jgi:choline dehydrogenase-like flavoprotein
MPHEPLTPQRWDVEADVVVVGFGAAGVAAAVTAHDLGAEVIILEKAPQGEHGGNTRVAGQGYLNTSAAEDAAAYLTALCGPFTVPETMIRVWADEMGRNNDWLASLGGDPQEHQHPPVGIEFPNLPGAGSVHKFHDGPTYGYSYTWQRFESLVTEQAARRICLGKGAARRGADLRRVREQPGDDPQLPTRNSLLLHLRQPLQRG